MKEEKAALRRAINERISALDEEYLRESDRGIWENVLSLPEFGSAGTVFAYLSVDRECDTRRIVDQLLQEGRRVALPRSRKGGVMDFALYDGTLAEGTQLPSIRMLANRAPRPRRLSLPRAAPAGKSPAGLERFCRRLRHN